MKHLAASLAIALWLTTSMASARLAMEPIREVIRRHLPAIRGCYDEGLARRPELEGRIDVVFTVDGTGVVSEASVQRSTLGDTTVEACVVGEVLRMRFPERAPGGFVRINYPFVFERPTDTD